MRLSDNLKLPSIRQPQGESREDFFSLSSGLNNAKQYVGTFEAALDLFANTRATASAARDQIERRRYSDFSFIAARDGAMSLYHYSMVVEHCGTLGHKLSEHLPHYDKRALRAAKAKFREAFPDVVSLRHTVGHSAELMGQERDTHVITSEVEKEGFLLKRGPGRIFISNGLINDDFTNTYMGKLVSYRINLDSLNTLVSCCEGLFAAFEEPSGT